MTVSPNNVEIVVQKIWRELLENNEIGLDDDFFDLGGKSLTAFQILEAVEDQFGVSLEISAFFTHNTIRRFSGLVFEYAEKSVDSGDQGSSYHAVDCLKQAVGPIVFGVHGAGGALFLEKLSRYLDDGLGLYALYGIHLDSPHCPIRDIYQLAACFVDEIEKIQPVGPLVICGRYGRIALEVAQQLLAREREVAMLIIFDNVGPHIVTEPKPNRLRRAVGRLLRTNRPERSAQDKWQTGEGGPMTARAINGRLSDTYRARRFAGRIILIRSDEFSRMRSKNRHLKTWGDIASDLSVEVVPGTHLGKWEEPDIKTLAERVSQCVHNALGVGHTKGQQS